MFLMLVKTLLELGAVLPVAGSPDCDGYLKHLCVLCDVLEMCKFP